MLTYRGKYGTAYVMLDEIESKTVQQIYEFLNNVAFTNDSFIMPDVHIGSGVVIGFTMYIVPDKVIPNVVGVDIGCGMESCNLGGYLFDKFNKDELLERIRNSIPFGTNVHTKAQFNNDPGSSFWELAQSKIRAFTMAFNKRFNKTYDLIEYTPDHLKKKCEEIGMDYERAILSIGTLGGGNHFIEIGISEKTQEYWCTVHSGSRQLGLKIAKYWQRQAGKGNLAFLEGDEAFGYLIDMVFAQCYADLNRDVMHQLIFQETGIPSKEEIVSVHNYIDFSDFIIRKGAIRSYEGEKMVIPYNMEDGIILCEGKSNPAWNFSAPHGAGRVDSRRWAKENLSLEDAKASMDAKGITYSKLPIDETKGAYKDPSIIENAIGPTAKIIDRLKPVLVLKD